MIYAIERQNQQWIQDIKENIQEITQQLNQLKQQKNHFFGKDETRKQHMETIIDKIQNNTHNIKTITNQLTGEIQ